MEVKEIFCCGSTLKVFGKFNFGLHWSYKLCCHEDNIELCKFSQKLLFMQKGGALHKI
jgi:hypothetical protein